MATKPSYGTSKKALWLSSALAWATIFLLVAGGLAGVPEAVALANITVPSMIVLIAAMLGIHRFSGSLDFRAMQHRIPEPPSMPPYRARDEPGIVEGEIT